MDAINNLVGGLGAALSPEALMFALAGVLIGTVIGVLPGIGPLTAIALLIPLSFGLEPAHGLILLCAIYYGSMFGGSITATLIKTPGELASVVIALDGYEMARRGRAGPALATAAWGSFIAGTVSLFALVFLSPLLARAALYIGSHEYFILMILALMMAVMLGTGSRVKAWLSVLVGLGVGVIGLDPQTGRPRMTFGQLELHDGIDFVIFAMALFAIPEAIKALSSAKRVEDKPLAVSGRIWMDRNDWRRSMPAYGRGTVLGFVVGVLPGIGPSLASFMSYLVERKVSKGKKQFGHGAIEGVAGPEAANNAAVNGAFIPLFSLGIPGSATTALLLFVFTMYGLQPGPSLFQGDSTLIWTIIASMYIGNVFLLALNLPLIGLFVKLLEIPPVYLFAGVLAFVVLGAYGVQFSLFGLVTLLAFGCVGYVMVQLDIPLAPAVLALVLQPLVESNLRRSLQISGGDITSFFERPVSLALIVLAFAVLAFPLVGRSLRARSDKVSAA